MGAPFRCKITQFETRGAMGQRDKLTNEQQKKLSAEKLLDNFLERYYKEQLTTNNPFWLLELCQQYIRECIDYDDANQLGKQVPSIHSCSKEFQFDVEEESKRVDESSAEIKSAIIDKVLKKLQDPSLNLDINQEDNKTRILLKKYLEVLRQRMQSYKEQNNTQDFERLATRFINIINILHSDLKLIKVSGFWENASVQINDSSKPNKLLKGLSQVDGVFAYDSQKETVTYHPLISSIECFHQLNQDAVTCARERVIKDGMEANDQLEILNNQVIDSFEWGHLLQVQDPFLPPPITPPPYYTRIETFTSDTNDQVTQTDFPRTPPQTPPQTPPPLTHSEAQFSNHELEELMCFLISNIHIDSEDEENGEVIKEKINKFLEEKKLTISERVIEDLINQFVKNKDGFNALNGLLVESEKAQKSEQPDVDVALVASKQILSITLDEGGYKKSEKNSLLCDRLNQIEKKLEFMTINLEIGQTEPLLWNAENSRVKDSIQKLKAYFKIQDEFFEATNKNKLQQLITEHKDFLTDHPCIDEARNVCQSIDDKTIEKLCETLTPRVLFELLYDYEVSPDAINHGHILNSILDDKGKSYIEFYNKKKIYDHVDEVLTKAKGNYATDISQDSITENAQDVVDKCLKKLNLNPEEDQKVLFTQALYENKEYGLKKQVEGFDTEAKAKLRCACIAPHFLDQHITADQEQALCQEIAVELFNGEEYINLATSILNTLKLAFYEKGLCPTNAQLRILYDILIKDSQNIQIDLLAGSGKTEALDLIEAVVNKLRELSFNNEFQVTAKDQISGGCQATSTSLNGLQRKSVDNFCKRKDGSGVKQGLEKKHKKLLTFIRKIWGAQSIELKNPRKKESPRVLNPISDSSITDFLNKKSTPQAITIHDDCDISSSCVVAADLAARVAFLEKTPESEAKELLDMYVAFLNCNYNITNHPFWKSVIKGLNSLLIRNALSSSNVKLTTTQLIKKCSDHLKTNLTDYELSGEFQETLAEPIEKIIGKMEALLIRCIKDGEYNTKKQALILDEERISEKLKPATVSYVETYNSMQDEEGLIAVMCPYNIDGVDQYGDIESERIFESYYDTLPQELRDKRKTFVMKDDSKEEYYLCIKTDEGISVDKIDLEDLIKMKVRGELKDAALLLRGSDQQRGSSWDLSNNKTNPIPMVVLFEKPTTENKICYEDFFDYLGIYLQYGQRIRGEQSNLSPVTLVGFNPAGYGESTDKIARDTNNNLNQIVKELFVDKDIKKQVLDLFNEGEELDLCTKITLMNIMIYSLRPILAEYKTFCVEKTIRGLSSNEQIKQITEAKITELMSRFKKFMAENPNPNLKNESFEKWYSRFLGSNT